MVWWVWAGRAAPCVMVVIRLVDTSKMGMVGSTCATLGFWRGVEYMFVANVTDVQRHTGVKGEADDEIRKKKENKISEQKTYLNMAR